jgi:hypothetical protein
MAEDGERWGQANVWDFFPVLFAHVEADVSELLDVGRGRGPRICTRVKMARIELRNGILLCWTRVQVQSKKQPDDVT